MAVDISPLALADESAYLTAFLAGVFGGVHCAGMCGGITGALVYGLPASVRQHSTHLLLYLSAYNVGRLLSYTIGGALVGLLGYLAGDLLVAYGGWFYLRFVAAFFMIAMGLYLAGWWTGLTHIERAGARLWAKLSPLSGSLLPVRRPGRAVCVGVLWGWLPCGLVYSVLVWAIAAGGWREGALFMLVFGLGTLPTLLAVGFAANGLISWVQRPGVRRLAGALVIAFGVLTLLGTIVYQPNVGLGCAIGEHREV